MEGHGELGEADFRFESLWEFWIRSVDQIGRPTLDPLGNSWGRDFLAKSSWAMGPRYKILFEARSFRLDGILFNS